ncbi:MarR family transcriptional regulator [Lactiplantibacillus daowaiensis]|uniref:MarR family transcriptional regulator n=1 Tax=Lactiplantibacillus daowaiensis TaxID=2559918 RepID=A0ABW1RZJ2_9LACO|nr:MarR family transcriptional regulator [Lactiplantibacillus daowaiensis]
MTAELPQQIAQQVRQLRIQKNTVNQEQAWMLAHLTAPQLQALLPKISIVGLHILSQLQAQPQTGIELATALSVTRGGVTRAAKTLTTLALITPFQPKTEHKKVYYRLTPRGTQIATVHDQMHATFNAAIGQALYDKYSDDELALVSDFLQDLLNFEANFNR